MKNIVLLLLMMTLSFCSYSQRQDDSIDYLNYGIEKYHNGDIPGTLQDLIKAIELSPSNHMAYAWRAQIKHESGDNIGAIKDYDITIKLSPYYFLYYYNRGVSKGALKNYKGAINDFNIAIELEPNDTVSYFNRGVCRSILGDLKEAIQDYDKVIELDLYYTEAYIYREKAKRELGNNREDIIDSKNYKPNSSQITSQQKKVKSSNQYENSNSFPTESYYWQGDDYDSYVGVRVGAICNDGSRSYATGSGACSYHGGVYYWLIE